MRPPNAVDTVRARLLDAGEEVLSDHELLFLLLGNLAGSRGTGGFSLTADLLQNTGGLTGLARCPPQELVHLRGLGKARACLLRAAIELGRRLAAPALSFEKPIGCATEVAEWFRCRLQDHERECIHALLLDGKHRPVRQVRVTEGSWTSCQVDPKVVFAACLRHSAPAVILVHNHPSGDPSPSRDDLELTERMVRAGAVVGVRVLDHLIVGRGGFFSLADAGLL